MEISRRKFLGAGLALGSFFLFAPTPLFPLKASNKELPQRPPGALPEREFNLRCIRCSRCGQACRPGAIYFGSWLDGQTADTPFVSPPSCNLCLECIDVCPTGALQEALLDRNLYKAYGDRAVYEISTRDCVLHNGNSTRCLLCYYACPRKDRAIIVGAEGRPFMDEKYCTGCGICEAVCPYKAISLRGGLR